MTKRGEGAKNQHSLWMAPNPISIRRGGEILPTTLLRFSDLPPFLQPTSGAPRVGSAGLRNSPGSYYLAGKEKILPGFFNLNFKKQVFNGICINEWVLFDSFHTTEWDLILFRKHLEPSIILWRLIWIWGKLPNQWMRLLFFGVVLRMKIDHFFKLGSKLEPKQEWK